MPIASNQFTVGDRTYEVLNPRTKGHWLRSAGSNQGAAMGETDGCYIYQRWQELPISWPSQQVTLAFPEWSEPGSNGMKTAYLRQFGRVWLCLFCETKDLQGPTVYLVRRVA